MSAFTTTFDGRQSLNGGNRVQFIFTPECTPEDRARLAGLSQAFAAQAVYGPSGFRVTPDRARKIKLLFAAGFSCSANQHSYSFFIGAQVKLPMCKAVTYAKKRLMEAAA